MCDARASTMRQAAALEEHRARLGAAAAAVRELGRRREALLTGRLETARRREVRVAEATNAQKPQATRNEGRKEGKREGMKENVYSLGPGHTQTGALDARRCSRAATR